MVKTEVMVYDVLGMNVRVFMGEKEPMFVLSDLCDVAKIKNASAVGLRIPEDEKGLCYVNTLGGSQRLLCVTEAGMYRVLLRVRSQNSWVQKFQHRVFHEVLPEIRRNGRYVPQETLRQIDAATAVLLHQSQIAEKMVELENKMDATNAMISNLPGHISHIVAAIVDKKVMSAMHPDNSETLDQVRVLKNAIAQLENGLTSPS